MKLHRCHLLLAITIVFTAFLIGVFIGRSTAGQYTLSFNGSTGASSAQASLDVDDTGLFIDGRLNINTATVNDLILLPGIGEVIAQRIIEYRTQNGPFNSVDELENVKGIGKTKLKQITDYITIGG